MRSEAHDLLSSTCSDSSFICRHACLRHCSEQDVIWQSTSWGALSRRCLSAPALFLRDNGQAPLVTRVSWGLFPVVTRLTVVLILHLLSWRPLLYRDAILSHCFLAFMLLQWKQVQHIVLGTAEYEPWCYRCKIKQTLLNWLAQNLVEWCGIGQGRTH